MAKPYYHIPVVMNRPVTYGDPLILTETIRLGSARLDPTGRLLEIELKDDSAQVQHMVHQIQTGLLTDIALNYGYRTEPDWENAPIGGSPGEIHPIGDDDHETLRAFRKWEWQQKNRTS